MHVLAKQFKILSEELSDLIEKEGWVVRPYQMDSLPFFSALSDEMKQSVCEELKEYLGICRQTQAAGHSISDARFLVNEAREHHGFYFHEDVNKLIEKGDVVEFYTSNHLQIFRTFNYFEYTSYTIEDIYCRPWFSLYERDDEVTKRILEMAVPVFAGKQLTPLLLDVGVHLITERYSLERLQLRNKANWIAPLFKDEDQIGYVNVLRVEPLT
ncbi:hypothetical protein [Bdellovibrio svalbardensis]|uniref:Uncharacterized protein n=1 Tax=Bdellovibrio svalbardensis TaxID=2972972 RepID=A0ABT6DGZ6_9BACT|nr:hypothetical protein [Bdellovibrio svalbardensis]MDG0816087.1 hypothetical protein [Bdellovibrio svalbardensis]